MGVAKGTMPCLLPSPFLFSVLVPARRQGWNVVAGIRKVTGTNRYCRFGGAVTLHLRASRVPMRVREALRILYQPGQAVSRRACSAKLRSHHSARLLRTSGHVMAFSASAAVMLGSPVKCKAFGLELDKRARRCSHSKRNQRLPRVLGSPLT